MEHELDDFDRGLAVDLGRLMERRNALKVFAGAGALAVLAACGSDAAGSAASTAGSAATDTTITTAATAATTATTTAAVATCTTVVPEETAGPYPGDGSNGPDILTEPDVVRSDITTSIGSFTGTAEGVPISISLTVLDSSKG
ncbi:MAG: hypothetical protein KBF94_18935, partial [Ilumatobacteraceae bacterium]|nr:hypothetical protein [Ilumatobacteraceae bacterium]